MEQLDTSPRVAPGDRALRSFSGKRRASRDHVALITWANATEAKVTCLIRLEWDRIGPKHPHLAPISVVGFALAQALAQNPVCNRRVALWKIHDHRTIRISFAIDATDDLRVAVVDKADGFSPVQFQQALREATRAVRSKSDPLGRAIRIVELLPVSIGRPLLKVWSLITAGFGIGMMGVPGAPFGVALISSVARFGLPAVEVPFVPFARCALVCSIGTLAETVIARDGVLAVVETIDLQVSFDHRICDASQLARLLRDFEAHCYSQNCVLSSS
jgi:2-oxoacid dehydrogenases acyltransferase (catalytic domain)